MLRIQTFTGHHAHPFVQELARLRMEIFRAFPYLYEGSLTYEELYLQKFLQTPDSLVVIAFDGERVVGASTGMPLVHESENIRQPWAAQNYDVQRIFYYGESVLEAPYRGQGVGVAFFQHREQWVRQLGGFERLTFCAVVRPDQHALRPPNYIPLDQFWQKRGFKPTPDLYCYMDWQDVDQAKETTKALRFWDKPLPASPSLTP